MDKGERNHEKFFLSASAVIAHIVDLVIIESHDISFFPLDISYILCMKKCNMVFAGFVAVCENRKINFQSDDISVCFSVYFN